MAGAIENQATSNCGTLLRTLASTANGMSLAISLRWKNWRGGRDLAWISRSHWIGSAKAATERRFLSYKDLAGASGPTGRKSDMLSTLISEVWLTLLVERVGHCSAPSSSVSRMSRPARGSRRH